MAYFEPYIDSEGIHIPTYTDIQEYLIDRYKAIFGSDAYISEETPDYQMISVFAKFLDDYAALAVDAYNARNPYFAAGNSLDILVELAGIIRRPATASTAVLTLTGDSGTQISTGNQAIDSAGYIWSLDEAVTIPESRSVDVGATCDTLGAIVATAGEINGIYTPVSGWTSVTNASAAVTGLDTETDAELRARFAKSHAVSDSGVMDSIVAGLINTTGVAFADVVQNSTGSTDSRGIPAHSICAIVDGGDDQDVATAIYRLKSPGVGTYGTTTKTVVDDQGHSNSISFVRPSQEEVTVNISLTKLAGYDDARVESMIRDSIINDISSLGIGKSWNVTMAYKDIYSAFAGEDVPFAITSLSATNSHGTSTSMMQCDFDEILSTDEAHIIITAT